MNAKVIRFPTCADLSKPHAMATKRGLFARLFRRKDRTPVVINRSMRVRK